MNWEKYLKRSFLMRLRNQNVLGRICMKTVHWTMFGPFQKLVHWTMSKREKSSPRNVEMKKNKRKSQRGNSCVQVTNFERSLLKETHAWWAASEERRLMIFFWKLIESGAIREWCARIKMNVTSVTLWSSIETNETI